MVKQYKINSQIIAPTLRLIAEDGKQVGILSKEEALEYALGQGADLVLITETAKPPVAKIIDFKKFLYQEQKKEQEAKKGQKNTGIKELRIGSPFAAEADVTTRINRARELLSDGFSIRLVIKFPGRSITKPEFGHRIVNRFSEELKNTGKLDRPAHLEGKQLVSVFAPSK